MSLDRLDELATVLKRLPASLTATTVQLVQDNAGVLELDNQEQLYAGLDADGQHLEPPYAGLTRELKKQKGQPTDRVTLKDKGSFYRGIVARVRGGDIELVGTDSKTAELEQKYGPDILGLSEEAIDAFREDYVRPELEYQTHYLLGV